MRVNLSARSGGIILISFRFFNMKVCCKFSSESPHLDGSNEHIQYTIFIMKKKITLDYPKSTAMFFSRTQEQVRHSRGKQAISVRAMEVLPDIDHE